MSEPGRVLILAPNWLGDAVMALPAIDDVRRRFSEGRLVVAARASVSHLFNLVPIVDEVVELEWRGRLGQLGALRRDVARLRGVGADVALLLPNSFAAAWVARRAAIPARWGYATDTRGPLLSRAVPKPPGSRHQGAYYQHLVRELGIPNGPLEPRVTIPPAVLAQARALLSGEGWDDGAPLVVFAPGAAYGTAKRWFPRHFAELATTLITERGARCALVGSGSDGLTTRAIAEMVPERLRSHVLDLCGRTSLESLAGVMALADACVSNDSGAMHVAAAVGVPLAAIFGPTNERETAPLPHADAIAQVIIHPVSCRPCMLRECPIDHPCMRDLQPSRVYVTVEEMLTANLERPH
jgi:heptosyltransferase-2